MKEKTLFKIAIVCSVLGLVSLFFISENITIKTIDISKIEEMDVGKEVKVIGRIERASDNEKVAFLEVGQETIQTVSITLFKEEEINLKKGDMIELIGEIDEFNGKKSIIANAIKVR